MGSPKATVYLFLGVGLTLDCRFCCVFEPEGDGALRLLLAFGLVPPLVAKLVIELFGDIARPRLNPRLRFELELWLVREEVGDTAR